MQNGDVFNLSSKHRKADRTRFSSWNYQHGLIDGQTHAGSLIRIYLKRALIYMYMYISVPNAGKLPAEAQTIYKRTIGLFANREADRK